MAATERHAGKLAGLQGEAMLLRMKAEEFAEKIEDCGAEAHLAAVRYKKARRVARRCMSRARNLQSGAMAHAKAMAGLRAELRNLERQAEWLEQTAGEDIARQVQTLKADLWSISELVERYATDADGAEQDTPG